MKFSDQVVAALNELHPGVKRDIRRAIDDVNQGKRRDVRSLRGRLAGFRRLRVGKYRVVFRYDAAGELIVEFLGPRNTVYATVQPRVASECAQRALSKGNQTATAVIARSAGQAQRRRRAPHRETPPLANQDGGRLSESRTSSRLRALPEVPLGAGLREETALSFAEFVKINTRAAERERRVSRRSSAG